MIVDPNNEQLNRLINLICLRLYHKNMSSPMPLANIYHINITSFSDVYIRRLQTHFANWKLSPSDWYGSVFTPNRYLFYDMARQRCNHLLLSLSPSHSISLFESPSLLLLLVIGSVFPPFSSFGSCMVVSAYEQQPSAKFKVKRILILISFPVKIQMNCNSNKQWMELFLYLQIRTNVSNTYNKRTSLWSVGVGDALTIYRDEAAAVRLSSLPPKQKTAFKFSSRH